MAESLLEFLQGIFGDSVVARYAIIFAISLLPGVGNPASTIPIGYFLLDIPLVGATITCIIGNFLPVPFIILFIRKIFDIMRKLSKRLGKIADKFENKAKQYESRLEKGAFVGLLLFVSIPIPLPGMGAWTGALISAIFNIRLKVAAAAIAIGVVIACLITVGATFGFIALFR